MIQKATFFLIAWGCLWQSSTGQTINTDRPDQTESSSVIPFQSFQIESGIQVDWMAQDMGPNQSFLLPTALLRYGLRPWLELRFNNSVSSYHPTGNEAPSFGLSDVELGVKIQLIKKENYPIEMAFLSHVVMPIGHQELSNFYYGSVNKLSISHPLPGNWSLGYNVGYNYFGTENGDITYSLALGFAISEKWACYVEPYGDVVNLTQHIAKADAGFTYLLQENIQLDFSGGIGLNETSSYVAIGISWNSQ